MPGNLKYVTADRDGQGNQNYALIMVEMNISIVDRIIHVGVDVVNTTTYDRYRTSIGIHDPDFTTVIGANLNGVFKTEIPAKFWNWLEQPAQEIYRAEIILGRPLNDLETLPTWSDTAP